MIVSRRLLSLLLLAHFVPVEILLATGGGEPLLLSLVAAVLDTREGNRGDVNSFFSLVDLP